MYTVEATIAFEAAHRLYGVDTYSSECRDSVHGHSYKVKAVVGRRWLNQARMVVDFKLLKNVMKGIEDTYDHTTILRDCDPLVEAFKQCAPESHINIVKNSPTAEWMAQEYYNVLAEALTKVDPDIVIVSVSVQETEKNIATYTKESYV